MRTLDMKEALEARLRDSEILLAIKSFKSLKALGPNGLHLMFYKKFWPDVSPWVISFCKEVFSTSTMLVEHKNTLLCLIQKFRNAQSLKNFRPIGLCNTSYKIVIKSLLTESSLCSNTSLSQPRQAFSLIGGQLTRTSLSKSISLILRK